MKFGKDKSGKKEKDKEKKKVFGAVLDRNCTEIPRILEACVVYLDATGLDIEGVFRKSGSLNQMNSYKEKFDSGEDVDFSEVVDPHIVAGLLKMYIREYPEPLLTFELYDCFLAAIAVPDVSLKVPKVKQVLTMLPPANLMIVKYLVSFLSRVTAHSSTNFMTPGNLAIVFAPNILRPPYEGEKGIGIMVEDTPYANELLQLLINHYEPLFKDDPKPAQKPTPTPAPAQTNHKALPTPPVAASTRPPAASHPLPALPTPPSSTDSSQPPKRHGTFVQAVPSGYPTENNPFAPAPPPKTTNRKFTATKPLPHVPSSEIVAPAQSTPQPTLSPTPTPTPPSKPITPPTASVPAPPPKPAPAPPAESVDGNPFGNPFETNPFETSDAPPKPAPSPPTTTPANPPSTAYPSSLNPFGPSKRLPSPPPYQAPPPPDYNAPPPPYQASAPPAYHAPPPYEPSAPPAYNAPPPPIQS